MIFVKLIKNWENKEVYETLVLPSGNCKYIETNRLLVYDVCFNSCKAIPIFKADLRKLYQMKIEENKIFP